MKTLSVQAVILISVLAICISSVAIALITTDNCPARPDAPHIMMHQPPPPPGMFGGAQEGFQRRGQSKNFSRGERRPQ